jgi:hypothetical protein
MPVNALAERHPYKNHRLAVDVDQFSRLASDARLVFTLYKDVAMQLTEEVHELVIFHRLRGAVLPGCAVLTACVTVIPKLLDPKTPSYSNGLRFYEMRALRRLGIELEIA